jgi:hypothetical protein
MISECFKAYELVDKTTYESFAVNEQYKIFDLIDSGLLIALDWIKKNIAKEKKMIVNDWKWNGKFQWRGLRNKRCPEFREHSMHSFGRAIDFHIEGMSAKGVRKMIMDASEVKELFAIKRMEDGVNWVHIDSCDVPGKRIDKHQRIYLFKA